MEMKSNILKTIGLGLSFAALTACSDWVTPEPVFRDEDRHYNENIQSPADQEYFASLRKWKETPELPQVFVWFDSWSGSSNTGSESLRALPDSVTIASNWGLHGADTTKFDLSESRKYDMDILQRVKGTKLVYTMFSRFPGEGLPRSRYPHWYDESGNYIYYRNSNEASNNDPEAVRPYLRKYAEDLYHACVETGYDGYDWDFEPGFGMGDRYDAQLWYNETQCQIFVEEMSYWFGRYAMDPTRDRGGRPMPEKRLLFLIDGAIGWYRMCGMETKYFDYFILQAYHATTKYDCESRVKGAIEEIKEFCSDEISDAEIVKRIILTENFESYASTGGGCLVQSQYIHDPVDQQIGGCGLYRVGFDYDRGKQSYNFLPQMITNIYSIWRDRQNNKEE